MKFPYTGAIMKHKTNHQLLNEPANSQKKHVAKLIFLKGKPSELLPCLQLTSSMNSQEANIMQKLIPWAAGSLTFNLVQSWQKNRDCNKNAFKTFKLQKHSRTSLKVLLRAETLAINSGHTQTNQHGKREDLDAGKGKKTKQGGCVFSFPTTEIEYLLCSQMRNRQKAAMQKFHKVRHDAKRNGNAKWQKDNKDAAVTANGKRTSRHVSWQPAFETSGLPVFRKTTTGTKPSDTKQQEGRKKRRTRMSSLPKTQTSKKKKRFQTKTQTR